MHAAASAGAGDLLMADAQQIGGVTGWLRAAEVLKQVWSPSWRRELLIDCASRFDALQMPWYRGRAEELMKCST